MDKWKTKYLNQERYDMVQKQLSCDYENMRQVMIMLRNNDITKRQYDAYENKYTTSLRQQEYALKKGRFR